MEKIRECPNCGREKTYASKGGGYERAVKNNLMCKGCTQMLDETKHLAREIRENEGRYAVYFIPSTYRVGQSEHPRQRLAQHHNDGTDLTDVTIIGWYDDYHAAHDVETHYHKMGYCGSDSFKHQYNYKRLLYEQSK